MTRKFTIDDGVRFYYIGSTYVAGQQVGYFDHAEVERGEGAAALRAGVPEQRGDVLGDGAPGEEPADRRDPEQHLHRQARAGIRRLLQRHEVVDGTPYDGLGHHAGAARRLRVGRQRRRQDRGPRRLRHVLRPLLRTTRSCRSSRSRRCMDTRTTNFTTIPQLLSSQLVQSPAGPARSTPATSSRRRSTTGASACSASCRGSSRPTSPTSATPAATAAATRADQQHSYGTTRSRLNPAATPIRPTARAASPAEGDRLPAAATAASAGSACASGPATANYHSIQVSVNRRLPRGFAFGVSYTGSDSQAAMARRTSSSARSARRPARRSENAAADKAGTRNTTPRNGSRPHNVVHQLQLPGAARQPALGQRHRDRACSTAGRSRA